MQSKMENTLQFHTGHFPAGRNSIYELLFFRKTDNLYVKQKDTATEITLD